MKLLLASLLFTIVTYSQSSKLTIDICGDKVVYNLKSCYKKLRQIKTTKGIKFRVVVWNGYAPWSKGYSLILRSKGGKYIKSIQIDNLVDDVEIYFK